MESFTIIYFVQGIINSAPECVNIDKFICKSKANDGSCLAGSASSSDQSEKSVSANPKSSRLPNMEPLPGTNFRFSQFPEKPHRKDATPSEISRGNIDSSYTVTFILDQLPK